MAVSARLLFVASLVMLVACLGHAVYILSNAGMTGPSLSHEAGWPAAMLIVIYSAFLPAAYVFAASAAVHQLSRLGQHPLP